MQMTPVSSSHVEAFAYFEQETFLLVRFKGGALQGWLDFTEQQAADFLAAESKGQFLARLPNISVGISRKRAQVSDYWKPVTLDQVVDGAMAATALLATLDEDAGRCCTRHLRGNQSQLTGPWDCPDCGLSFEPVMVGPVKHFRIKPFVKVLR